MPPPAAAEWHIFTGEFPPRRGGVGDYTALLALSMTRANTRVTVWCPAGSELPRGEAGALTLRDASFGPRGLLALGAALSRERRPRRLLIQYVPHAFGLRGVNVLFCGWALFRRWVAGDDVQVLFHEPFLPLEPARSLRHNAAALVQRAMAALLLQAARKTWISIPSWRTYLRPYALLSRPRMAWLPIPATIPPVRDEAGVARLREELAPGAGRLVIGHFGTFGAAIAETLAPALLALLAARPERMLVLLGRGSRRFAERLASADASLTGRVRAVDEAPAADLSRHLQVCDLLVQPYPDGVSTRRTTAMAALCHGLALVTTAGPLTERFWVREEPAVLAPANDAAGLASAAEALLVDPAGRSRIARRGHALYRAHFGFERVVERLLA